MSPLWYSASRMPNSGRVRPWEAAWALACSATALDARDSTMTSLSARSCPFLPATNALRLSILELRYSPAPEMSSRWAPGPSGGRRGGAHSARRDQVCDGGLVEERPHPLGVLLPAELRRAGREVAAAGASQHAAPPFCRKERPDDGAERQLLGPRNQLKAAERTAGGVQDAGPCQLVEGLGEVVARNAQRLCDVAHSHGLTAGRLGDVIDGAKRVLGRLRQGQHMNLPAVILSPGSGRCRNRPHRHRRQTCRRRRGRLPRPAR